MKQMTSLLLLTTFLLPLFPILVFVTILRLYCKRQRVPGSFAFFHPYCDAGGGGERVLWLAINALQDTHPRLQLVVYTGDIDRSPEQILQKARSRFGIKVRSDRLYFIYLKWRWLLEARNYPRLTLFFQLFGGFLLGCEALWRHCPEWLIDTTGCPLVLPLFRWVASANTICYVHYPTITSEMVKIVSSRTATYNNAPVIAASRLLSNLKLRYYQCIALIYRACGNSAQLVMVNGSWTSRHISDLWRCQPHIVYPPCDVDTLLKLEPQSEEAFEQRKTVLILSVGQIRPEKNHLEQLRIFAEVRQQLKERDSQLKTKLVIVGGCRNEDDKDRVNFLKKYALGNFQLESEDEIDSDKDLIWRLNIPFEELTAIFQEAMVGLHTMWNEHFGISVVEGMAAGIIQVANNSGGPKLDIIGYAESNQTAKENDSCSKCGYLASTKEEYVDAILQIMDLSRAERDQIRVEARKRVKRFSDAMFERAFCAVVEPLLLHSLIAD